MKKRYKIREIEKYNADNLDNLKRIDIRMKRIGKFIIISMIIIFLTIIFHSIISTKQMKYSRLRKELIKVHTGTEIEEISIKTSINGNGFYKYKLKDIEEIEIHAFFHRGKDIFIEDSNERIYKYFFEKWNDIDKNKFVVVEEYEDYKYNFTTKENWFLNYKTYIEVKSYEEMIGAVESIIRFKKTMGNYSSNIIKCYIKIGNNMILPNNVSPQTDDAILKSAQRQYIDVIKNNNLNYDDIPKEILESYY